MKHNRRQFVFACLILTATLCNGQTVENPFDRSANARRAIALVRGVDDPGDSLLRSFQKSERASEITLADGLSDPTTCIGNVCFAAPDWDLSSQEEVPAGGDSTYLPVQDVSKVGGAPRPAGPTALRGAPAMMKENED